MARHGHADTVLRQIRPGREWIEPDRNMPRHRHLDAYALVVLSGAFEQISYAGRVVVRAGEMLVQPTLDCHANALVSAGAEILRLAWPRETGLGGVHRLRDMDELVRLAERDAREAAEIALDCVRHWGMTQGECRDWPDLLAAHLAGHGAGGIRQWARAHGLARETVARGFARAYGVPPTRFRTELRTRRAWLRITGTEAPLAQIAAELGFADQSAMTRAVKALTGAPPAAWRRRAQACTSVTWPEAERLQSRPAAIAAPLPPPTA